MSIISAMCNGRISSIPVTSIIQTPINNIGYGSTVTLYYSNIMGTITPNGYIYFPTRSTMYYVIIDGSIATNGKYLFKDILAGVPPVSGILPNTVIDMTGLMFTLTISNNSGLYIDFSIADNSTSGLYTYFAYNGNSVYTISPLGILYIEGYFTSNSIIHFTNVYVDSVNMLQYAQIADNDLLSGYTVSNGQNTTPTYVGVATINLSDYYE